MYTLTQFSAMVEDRIRSDAYARALAAVVRPDSVVLDLGTGTGLFALMACRLGARRVYAVDPHPAIELARRLARANGFEDRIEFFEDGSTRVELPERADVLVSDLRGTLPIHHGHLRAILDARARLLAPDAVMIPRADTLWATVVEDPEFYRARYGMGRENPWDLDLAPAHDVVVHEWTTARFRADQALAEAVPWLTLEYASIESADASGTAAVEIVREGVGHGMAVWFDADLAEGVGYSNAPGSPTVYWSGFFPWPEPVRLEPGSGVEVRFRASSVAGIYLWRWDSRVVAPDGSLRAEFRQSSFQAMPIDPGRLGRGAADATPRLSVEGEIDRFVLSRMDGGTTVAEIATELRERFPDRFASDADALSRVGELARRHGGG